MILRLSVFTTSQLVMLQSLAQPMCDVRSLCLRLRALAKTPGRAASVAQRQHRLATSREELQEGQVIHWPTNGDSSDFFF